VGPRGKTAPEDLRRRISAIFWRHQSGAKWRSVPAELDPWWLAAQLFIRWAKQGVWERLLELVRQRGVALGITFIDGTNIRAHHKGVDAENGDRGAGRRRADGGALLQHQRRSSCYLRSAGMARSL
jgi:transposase